MSVSCVFWFLGLKDTLKRPKTAPTERESSSPPDSGPSPDSTERRVTVNGPPSVPCHNAPVALQDETARATELHPSAPGSDEGSPPELIEQPSAGDGA